MEGKKSAVPTEWLISLVCEEFHCLPSEAVEQLLDHDQLVMDILEFRTYARLKEIVDNAKDPKDIPDHPMVDQVFLIQHELLKRRRGEA